MNDKNASEYLLDKYPMNMEMLRNIIESIPANVFFKDLNCQYRMTSHVCAQISAEGDYNAIIGKTDLEIQPDPELGKFYYEDDKKIISSLEGSHYVSKMVFDGMDYYYEITKNPVFDSKGTLLGIIGLVVDISELKRLQKKLQKMSIIDCLTDTYNRAYYEQRTTEVAQTSYETFSIIMSDSNALKFFNDHYGHTAGDELLIKTAALLKRIVGNSGEVMRIGGDEFVVFCENCTNHHCAEIVKKIKSSEIDYKIRGLSVNNAYGYSTITNNNKTINAAISEAESMMYQDKSNTKKTYIKELHHLMK